MEKNFSRSSHIRELRWPSFKKLSKNCLCLAIFCGIAGQSATSFAEKIKRWSPKLESAIVLTFSPQAIDFSKERLLFWLDENVDLKNINIPNQNFSFPMDLSSPENAELKKNLNLALRLFDIDYKVSDPNFQIEVGSGALEIATNKEMSSFSWEAHPKGVLLKMELMIDKVAAKIAEVKLKDTANPILGDWLIRNISVANRIHSSAPLTLKTELLLGISPTGQMEAKVLSQVHNLQDVHFMLKAEKIESTTVSKISDENLAQKLKNVPLEIVLSIAQGVILNAAKENIAKALAHELPKTMNEKLEELGKGAYFVSQEPPPQSPQTIKPEEYLDIKIAPVKIFVDKFSQLKVQLSSQIQDPVMSVYLNQFLEFHPSTEKLAGDDDLLIELNPDYMNQLLHQSYYRKYFTALEASVLDFEFFNRPQFYVSHDGEFRVKAEMELKKPLRLFEVELETNFVKRLDGNFNLVADGTVENSFHELVGDVTIINWSANKALRFLDSHLRKSPYLLQDGIPLPESVGPLHIGYSRVEFQSYPENPRVLQSGSVKIFGTVK